MSHLLRVFFFGLIFTFILAGCGRTIQEEAPEAVNEATESEEDSSDETIEDEEAEFAHLLDLSREMRYAVGQAGMDEVVQQAQADGYSDIDISQAMGLAYFWTPGKRVLMSVTFVRFKGESATPASELDEAFEYASTAPWVRRAEAEEAAEMAAEEAVLENLPENVSDDAVSISTGGDTMAADPREGEEATEEVIEEDEDEEERPSRLRRWFGWVPGVD